MFGDQAYLYKNSLLSTIISGKVSICIYIQLLELKTVIYFIVGTHYS
jgi:hypothetical protein